MPTASCSSKANARRSAAAEARATNPSATGRTRRTASVADGSLTLYQAEWCPFSSAVREALTELGLTFTARQVEPWPEQREELRRMAGTDQIPVLRSEDGSVHL